MPDKAQDTMPVMMGNIPIMMNGKGAPERAFTDYFVG